MSCVIAPRHQDLAVGQQGGGVIRRGRCEGAGGRSRSPWPGRRARRWPDNVAADHAPRHQDLAVGQQGGGVIDAGRCRGSRWGSRSRWPGRRARRWPDRPLAAIAPRHQDLAVGQQGGRVAASRPVLRGAGGGPGPGGRVVELGAGSIGDCCHHTPATRTLPLGSRVAVWSAAADSRGSR